MTLLADWPALVLTAGLATRLHPLSSARAKAAFPVAGTVLIERILRRLRDAGVRRVVLNLHHRPATITRVVGDGRAFGLAVRYSWEDPLLGSAGGPRRALPLLEADRFFLVNGDTLTDVDLGALAAAHRAHGALVTLAVTRGDVSRYGGVRVGPAGEVTGFVRAGAGASTRDTWHFVGVQAAEAAAFADVPADRPSETIAQLYPRLLAGRAGAVRAFRTEAAFLDIGTPADYLAAVRQVAAQEGRPLDVGRDCAIHPTARVVDSVLWDRVAVGPGARVERSVLADGVEIPAGAVIRDAAVARGAAGLDVRALA